MTRPTEDRPATVPLAQQAGEIPARWRWVEPSVWTERMLTALEQGVEGGKWFSLIDKVFAERNLLAAFQRVASKEGAAGVDHVTVTQFERGLPETLWEVSDQLKHGTYQPQAIRRVHIPKPGTDETRPLGIPTVRDRVVQAAVVNVLEPIFERDFAEQSYGFRPGRGCKDALRRVDELLKAGYVHVVDADLKSYFDTIPHDGLMAPPEGEDRRRPGAVADRIVPEGGPAGRPGGMDAGDGSAPGGGPEPAVEQHLPRPARPSGRAARGSRWCAMRTTS